MSSPVVSSAPVTSWWYGQGGAVGVVRRLETLYTLTPAPAAAGLVTARRDDLTVTFVDALRAPLPQPWQPADSGSEARISWAASDPGSEPDPTHPVYLVVFGTTDDGGLVAMNLAAFSRIRIDGERGITTALVGRWVLELLATHPGITIGVSADVWNGPLTTRVRPVRVGDVPHTDVLICGPDLSYSDRSQIVSNATAPIMVDLGADAAVDTKWTISCAPDRLGQISNGPTRAMSVTLIVPTADTVDRCYHLLTDTPGAPRVAVVDEPVTDPQLRVFDIPGLDAVDASGYDDPIDFFAPQSGPPSDSDGVDDGFAEEPWPAATNIGPTEPAPALPAWVDDAEEAADLAEPAPAVPPPPAAPPPPAVPAPPVVAVPESVAAGPAEPGAGADERMPVVAPLWNRLLGQVGMFPPEPGSEPGAREKRLNELLVFLQLNLWVNSAEIIGSVYGGAASEKTVTQQVSLLRARLGTVRAGGPRALPPMRDGGYHLDSAVRSDWMEFERLVEILIETTPTNHLIVAMDLVTGPPLGGITPKEWEWTTDVRDEMRDRVAGAAVVLARRHHDAKKFSAAVEVARKGLWYDTARQDLWQVGMQAALDGHDHDAFKALRSQYLRAVAGPDRDPAVFDLTKQAG